jgi:hypothetical protein
MKRSKALRALLIAFALTPSSNLRAAILDDNNRFPDFVRPGQTVTVSGPAFDPAKPKVIAKLYPLGSADDKDAREAKHAEVTALKQAAVTLPDNLPPGRYYLKLTYEGSTEQAAGELRVQADAVKVEVDSAYPTTAYKNKNGSFDFEVIGQNFNPDAPEDNQIYISGQGPIINDWSAEEKHCVESRRLPCLLVKSPEKLHVFGYKSDRYQGPLSFYVKVGSAQSAEKRLTLSRVSETGVRILSILVFLVLVGVIYLLIKKGIRDNTIDGERRSHFGAFFIDRQTNSYSLSKFQLFAYFFVFVYGYLYVFFCRWLVQWQFELPDVPGSFSVILAMSTGATLTAAGATALRGSKGAGRVRPSPADFITTGGQVVPERFQFFVWTLVACIGFTVLLFYQDPATIEGFPKIPEGLLLVMGVSASGYVGGKLARAAGPVIRNIALGKDETDSTLQTITIEGENLSSAGDFFVDDKKLDIQPNVQRLLVKPFPQEQKGPDGTFCSKLIITIAKEANLDLTTGDHNFRIMNKDGQFADDRFTADLPNIDSVLEEASSATIGKEITSGNSVTKIKITGSGFRSGATVKWKRAGAKDPDEYASDAVIFVNTKAIQIGLVPGDVGDAILTLVTPDGHSAMTTVKVV